MKEPQPPPALKRTLLPPLPGTGPYTWNEIKWIIPVAAALVFIAYWFFMGLGYLFRNHNTGVDHSQEVPGEELEWRAR